MNLFYSYHFRDRTSGALLSYGEGMMNLTEGGPPIIDRARVLILERIHEMFPGLDLDSGVLHILALTPL